MKKLIIITIVILMGACLCLTGCDNETQAATETPTAEQAHEDETTEEVSDDTAAIIPEVVLYNVGADIDVPIQLVPVDLTALVAELKAVQEEVKKPDVSESQDIILPVYPIVMETTDVPVEGGEEGEVESVDVYSTYVNDTDTLKLYSYEGIDPETGEPTTQYVAYGGIFDITENGEDDVVPDENAGVFNGTLLGLDFDTIAYLQEGTRGFYPVDITIEEVIVTDSTPITFPEVSLDAEGRYIDADGNLVNATGEYVDVEGNVVDAPVPTPAPEEPSADPTEKPTTDGGGSNSGGGSGNGSGSGSGSGSGGNNGGGGSGSGSGGGSGSGSGSGGGNTSTPPPANTPAPDPNAGKTWYEEQGHWEEKVVTPAREEPVYETVKIYTCHGCGQESQGSPWSAEHLFAHREAGQADSQSSSTKERQTGTKTIPAVTEKVWVVDRPAGWY